MKTGFSFFEFMDINTNNLARNCVCDVPIDNGGSFSAYLGFLKINSTDIIKLLIYYDSHEFILLLPIRKVSKCTHRLP